MTFDAEQMVPTGRPATLFEAELTHTINAQEREITELVGQIAPQLLTEPGFGPLTVAKLVGEIAGAQDRRSRLGPDPPAS